jgi:hypothetical protein
LELGKTKTGSTSEMVKMGSTGELVDVGLGSQTALIEAR